MAVALIGLVGRRLRDAMRRIESLSSPGVLLGITPETLSRSLTRLVSARILHRLGPGQFQVLDPEALRQAAQSVDASRTPL